MVFRKHLPIPALKEALSETIVVIPTMWRSVHKWNSVSIGESVDDIEMSVLPSVPITQRTSVQALPYAALSCDSV